MSERVAADDDQARRADYLAEVTSTLYPPVEQTGETRYIAVPDAKRPRVLVPAASRRLAAAALRRYARPASRLANVTPPSSPCTVGSTRFCCETG